MIRQRELYSKMITNEEIEKIIDNALKYFDFTPKQGIALEEWRKWYEKRKQIKGLQDENK